MSEGTYVLGQGEDGAEGEHPELRYQGGSVVRILRDHRVRTPIPHVENTARNQHSASDPSNKLTNSREMPAHSHCHQQDIPSRHGPSNPPRNRTQPTDHRNLQPALAHDVRQQGVIHILALELGGAAAKGVFEGEKVGNLAEQGSFDAGREVRESLG